MSDYEFEMTDTWGDKVTVEQTGHVVEVRVFGGSDDKLAILDRPRVKKLRKALKRAVKALDE